MAYFKICFHIYSYMSQVSWTKCERHDNLRWRLRDETIPKEFHMEQEFLFTSEERDQHWGGEKR